MFGIAEHRERLRAGGQHVKRGLLLHGPPGTGKTLTVRYVAGRARDHTIVVLAGGGLGMVRPACALARMLQPSIVVLEDVDLVAQHRGYVESNPLLFDILNQMDGIAEDADVAFLLTTNRADLLEPALAARPGRVDLALHMPLRMTPVGGPDPAVRAGSRAAVADPDAVVRRTAGVTASFIKELMRKAALIAAVEAEAIGAPIVTDAHLGEALDELLADESEMTRALLGGAAASSQPGNEWLIAREAAARPCTRRHGVGWFGCGSATRAGTTRRTRSGPTCPPATCSRRCPTTCSSGAGDRGRALAAASRRGMQGRFGGLDALRARLRERRAQEQDALDLAGPLEEVRERLDEILERERSTLSFRAEDDARMREAFLDSLPPDAPGQIRELQDYRFVDPEAQRQFDELMESAARAGHGRVLPEHGRGHAADVARGPRRASATCWPS